MCEVTTVVVDSYAALSLLIWGGYFSSGGFGSNATHRGAISRHSQ